MQIEILHSVKGDKKKNLDTKTPTGRSEADALLKLLCEQKCCVLLERGKKTYRVMGYDAKADKLIVETGVGKKAKTSTVKVAGYKVKGPESKREAKVVAVAPVAGGAA